MILTLAPKAFVYRYPFFNATKSTSHVVLCMHRSNVRKKWTVFLAGS